MLLSNKNGRMRSSKLLVGDEVGVMEGDLVGFGVAPNSVGANVGLGVSIVGPCVGERVGTIGDGGNNGSVSVFWGAKRKK